MPDTTIHTAGPVLERLGPVLYRAALPNGKRVLAHLSRALTREGAEFVPGTRVVMELTAYDFDHARILRTAEPGENGGNGGKHA
ncbi:MAG: hypothetical protein MUF04_08995 [Akkermansiaceae bacterium]|jgi:translation initiation factor IF-1|nr:hypothetical protein [Akkermansiaceae bacterium]